MKQIRLWGFLVFLLIYGILKFRAYPELMTQRTYIQSTLTLIVLTAIIPYCLAWLGTKPLTGLLKVSGAILLPLLLCIAGLALFFFVYIAPTAPDMSVMQVLPRAVVPGLVMGLILAAPDLIRRTASET